MTDEKQKAEHALGADIAPAQGSKASSHDQTLPKSRVFTPANEDQPVIFLDPRCIGHGPAPNRGVSDYQSEPYLELERQIENTGGNTIPIRVVLLSSPIGNITHHLTYGHRRHHACLALGLPIRSIVITNTSAEVELEEQMMENEGRAYLTPYDFGKQCLYRLENRMFPTQMALAAKLGRRGSAEISNGVTLASLPAEVIEAFADPSELGYRDAAPLKAMVEKNRSAVIEAAVSISQGRGQGKPWLKEQVMATLRAAANTLLPASPEQPASGFGPSKTTSATAIKCGDILVGQIVLDKKGGTTMTLTRALDEKQRVDLAKRVAKLYGSSFVKPTPPSATTAT